MLYILWVGVVFFCAIGQNDCWHCNNTHTHTHTLWQVSKLQQCSWLSRKVFFCFLCRRHRQEDKQTHTYVRAHTCPLAHGHKQTCVFKEQTLDQLSIKWFICVYFLSFTFPLLLNSFTFQKWTRNAELWVRCVKPVARGPLLVRDSPKVWSYVFIFVLF